MRNTVALICAIVTAAAIASLPNAQAEFPEPAPACAPEAWFACTPTCPRVDWLVSYGFKLALLPSGGVGYHNDPTNQRVGLFVLTQDGPTSWTYRFTGLEGNCAFVG